MKTSTGSPHLSLSRSARLLVAGVLATSIACATEEEVLVDDAASLAESQAPERPSDELAAPAREGNGPILDCDAPISDADCIECYGPDADCYCLNHPEECDVGTGGGQGGAPGAGDEQPDGPADFAAPDREAHADVCFTAPISEIDCKDCYGPDADCTCINEPETCDTGGAGGALGS